MSLSSNIKNCREWLEKSVSFRWFNVFYGYPSIFYTFKVIPSNGKPVDKNEGCDRYLMSQKLDVGEFKKKQFRQAYVFTDKDLFYFDGTSIQKIEINSKKLTSLKSKLKIVDEALNDKCVELTRVQLSDINLLSGHTRNKPVKSVLDNKENKTSFLDRIYYAMEQCIGFPQYKIKHMAGVAHLKVSPNDYNSFVFRDAKNYNLAEWFLYDVAFLNVMLHLPTTGFFKITSVKKDDSGLIKALKYFGKVGYLLAIPWNIVIDLTKSIITVVSDVMSEILHPCLYAASLVIAKINRLFTGRNKKVNDGKAPNFQELLCTFGNNWQDARLGHLLGLVPVGLTFGLPLAVIWGVHQCFKLISKLITSCFPNRAEESIQKNKLDEKIVPPIDPSIKECPNVEKKKRNEIIAQCAQIEKLGISGLIEKLHGILCGKDQLPANMIISLLGAKDKNVHKLNEKQKVNQRILQTFIGKFSEQNLSNTTELLQKSENAKCKPFLKECLKNQTYIENLIKYYESEFVGLIKACLEKGVFDTKFLADVILIKKEDGSCKMALDQDKLKQISGGLSTAQKVRFIQELLPKFQTINRNGKITNLICDVESWRRFSQFAVETFLDISEEDIKKVEVSQIMEKAVKSSFSNETFLKHMRFNSNDYDNPQFFLLLSHFLRKQAIDFTHLITVLVTAQCLINTHQKFEQDAFVDYDVFWNGLSTIEKITFVEKYLAAPVPQRKININFTVKEAKVKVTSEDAQAAALNTRRWLVATAMCFFLDDDELNFDDLVKFDNKEKNILKNCLDALKVNLPEDKNLKEVKKEFEKFLVKCNKELFASDKGFVEDTSEDETVRNGMNVLPNVKKIETNNQQSGNNVVEINKSDIHNFIRVNN